MSTSHHSRTSSQNDNPIRALLRGEVFLPRDRQRLRELTTLTNITPEQQEWIWSRVMSPWCNEAQVRAYMDRLHREQGAEFAYPLKRGGA